MQILFLGRLAEQFGKERRVDLAATATVADAIAKCTEDEAPVLAAPGITYVLDHQVVSLDARLGEAKELAFLPPVSGG